MFPQYWLYFVKGKERKSRYREENTTKASRASWNGHWSGNAWEHAWSIWEIAKNWKTKATWKRKGASNIWSTT